MYSFRVSIQQADPRLYKKSHGLRPPVSFIYFQEPVYKLGIRTLFNRTVTKAVYQSVDALKINNNQRVCHIQNSHMVFRDQTRVM